MELKLNFFNAFQNYSVTGNVRFSLSQISNFRFAAVQARIQNLFPKAE